ncbi:MAG: 50S ribosomal protein L25 [Dehalococcoidia bacterium]|jgi:large subunit ribosomal protein L25
MDRVELEAANRGILGKKVKHLRRQGITPVHVFGHGVKSLALQCDNRELERALGQAGHTALISLKLDEEKRPRTVVVREVDRDWRRGELLHVDFYQVRMGEKIRLEVPVVLLGEAPALRSKANMLEHELETLTVECLPGKIPAGIEVDISGLAEPDQAIRVKDIGLEEDIVVLNDPELVVVKIGWRSVEKVEEEVVEVAEEAVEAPTEAAAGKEQPEET